jgi:hypothetical protein
VRPLGIFFADADLLGAAVDWLVAFFCTIPLLGTTTTADSVIFLCKLCRNFNAAYAVRTPAN